MGRWKTSTGNIFKGSAICNIKPHSRDWKVTNERSNKQTIFPETFLNRPELEFKQNLDYQPTVLKNQSSYAIQIKNSEPWRRYQDAFIFARLKGSSSITSVKMQTEGSFASLVGNGYIFTCDQETLIPDIYDTHSETSSNAFAYSDDSGNSRTLFTLTGNLSHLQIRTGDVLSFSGTSVASLNNSTNYTAANVSRPSGQTISFTLTEGAGGSDVDFHSGESPVTGAAATISHLATSAAATVIGFGDHPDHFRDDNDDYLETITPTAINHANIWQWNFPGRSISNICYEQQYYKFNNTVSGNLTTPNNSPRVVHDDSWVYLGISLLQPATFDSEKTSARLSVSVDYKDL